MALLFRDFDKRVEIRSTRDGRIRFRMDAEAVAYLREHQGRPGLADALRQALAEHRGLALEPLTDDQVIEEAVQRLLKGSLQLMETFDPRADAPSGDVQEEEPIVVPEPPAAPLPKAAAIQVPEAPLLPLLEEVQIEGAEVLPEIMQTLEQIDLTMAGIDMASVSLEPAPSGVPGISSAMQQASSSATATLEAM